MRLYEVIFLVIAVIMAVAYCGLGVAMLLGKVPILGENALLNGLVGFLFLAYGLFRGWRTYRKIDDFKQFDEE
jgi:hypothetical protein